MRAALFKITSPNDLNFSCFELWCVVCSAAKPTVSSLSGNLYRFSIQQNCFHISGNILSAVITNSVEFKPKYDWRISKSDSSFKSFPTAIIKSGIIFPSTATIMIVMIITKIFNDQHKLNHRQIKRRCNVWFYSMVFLQDQFTPFLCFSLSDFLHSLVHQEEATEDNPSSGLKPHPRNYVCCNADKERSVKNDLCFLTTENLLSWQRRLTPFSRM